MTEYEFELLDELYFLTNIEDLINALEWSFDKICHTLDILYDKGWIKIVDSLENEITNPDLLNNYQDYCFLATKKGLMAHNLEG